MLKIQFPRTKKGIYFWFLAFSSFLLFVSLATLLAAAGELSSSSSDLKNLKVVMPNLEEYVSYQAIDFRLNNSTLNTRRLKPSDIPKLADDVSVTINGVYRYRPDLLSYDLYGDSRLWWVFAMRNPNTITDPIWDFKEGTTIFVPKKATLISALGL